MVRHFVAWFIVGWSFVLPLTAAELVGTPVASMDRVVRSWQTEDGLPQESVNALAQTRDGFLWVGTSAGLARFDGARFRKFGLQDGLRSVLITALAEDREGALWAGTSGGGVSRWNAGRFTSFGARRKDCRAARKSSRSRRIATGRCGSARTRAWCNGAAAGSRSSAKRKACCAWAGALQLLHDSQGTLWVSVMLEGVFRGTGGNFARVEELGPEGGNVYCLAEGRDGAIWAGSNALWKWSGGAWKRFDSASGLPKSVLQTLAQSRDGTLWVGARSGGLYRSTGERFELAASDGPLATQSVAATMTDREGLVWTGVISGGLHRLAPRVLEYWGANAGLAPTTVTSGAEDASGALWLGTSSRGVQRFENGRFTPLADPASAGQTIIYCTLATSDGGIWAAGEQCLFRFQPGQPMKAYLDPPVRGEAIRAMCADGETLWLGTYYSTLLKCTADGVQVVAPPGSFPGGIEAQPGARSATDTLWVGTSAGLHRWERGKVRTWTTRDGLPTENIRALYRDVDGTLWIGTLGGGLARMKDGRFVRITMRQGLIDDVISQIVPDDFGALWLGCNRGIMRVERRELEALADGKISEIHPVVFGRNEGMVKEQCFGGTSPTAFKTRDGRIFFPTMNGLAGIDPRRLQELTPLVPQPRIDEITVDQRSRAPDAALVIPPGDHRLEVACTGTQCSAVASGCAFATGSRGSIATGARRAATGSLPTMVCHRAATFSVSLRPMARATGTRIERGPRKFSVQPFLWQTPSRSASWQRAPARRRRQRRGVGARPAQAPAPNRGRSSASANSRRNWPASAVSPCSANSPHRSRTS